MESETSQKNSVSKLKAAYYRSKMKLENASGLLGLLGLMKTEAETARNREAESRAVRQKLWGDDGGAAEDDMTNLVLGDMITTTRESKGMGALTKLAMAGLVASGIGLPIGGAILAPIIIDKFKEVVPRGIVCLNLILRLN